MKTRYKILLARAAYALVGGPRRLIGKRDIVRVRRRGLFWELDLREGIDLSIYLRGQFEPATAAAHTRWVRAGDVGLDVGANIGAHTLHLASLVGANGRVIAFEPTAYAFRKLCRNVSLNQHLTSVVECHQVLLGRTTGPMTHRSIYASWPLGGEREAHPKHFGVPKSTEGAVQWRLDDFLARHAISGVRFMKLDVDGHECEVLAGAQATLSRSRPVISMELAPYVLAECGSSVADLVALLAPHGYQFLRETDERALPSEAEALAGVVADGASLNVIASPRM